MSELVVLIRDIGNSVDDKTIITNLNLLGDWVEDHAGEALAIQVRNLKVPGLLRPWFTGYDKSKHYPRILMDKAAILLLPLMKIEEKRELCPWRDLPYYLNWIKERLPHKDMMVVVENQEIVIRFKTHKVEVRHHTQTAHTYLTRMINWSSFYNRKRCCIFCPIGDDEMLSLFTDMIKEAKERYEVYGM